MEEVPEVIAEKSVPDKVIDDLILEESVNVPDSVIAKPPPIHEVHSQLNLSEVRDPGLCNQNDLTLTPQIEEVVLLPDQGGKQIPVDSDLALGSIPHLAHLFDKAEKTGRKEKLRWYYYSEEFEKKAIAIALESNISDQMARTQIYDEMEPYLPGIDKIGLVTYSVDAIGSLTGAQIQNIINLYTAE
ncbi:2105_t:CDS:2, partial [Funneliformis geosporum]